MELKDLSIGGVLLTVVLMGGALGLFWHTNRKLMQRIVRSFVFMVGLLLALGVCLWTVCWLNKWWVFVVWTLLVAAAVSSLVAGKAHGHMEKTLPAVGVGVTAGLMVAGGCQLLVLRSAFSIPLLLGVILLEASQLYLCLPPSLQMFQSSLKRTQAHILYLEANGAARLEALMPSIARALRAAVLPMLSQWVQPLVVAPPLLLCGLLLAGVSVTVAVAVTMLSLMACFSGVVVASVLMVWIISIQLPRYSV